MKLIKNLIITTILFLVFCFATVYCGNESSKKQKNSIIGDYLFDYKEMDAVFFASGTGGQYIACIPDLDVVVVTTAKYSTDKSNEVAVLLLEKLIPAF